MRSEVDERGGDLFLNKKKKKKNKKAVTGSNDAKFFGQTGRIKCDM